MRDTVILMGTEEVSRAASRMEQAAETMRQVQGWWEDMLTRHRSAMEDLVMRFEAAADRIVTALEAARK